MAKRFERRIMYKRIDVPWEHKNTCFYCGEYSHADDHVPPTSRYHDFIALYDCHPPILVPACNQCNRVLSNTLQKDIYERFDECKELLLKRLDKYLMYGNIWDEDSLDYAKFTGDLGKFSKAIVKEAKVAKSRLEWEHWNVSVEGVDLEKSAEGYRIKMDGKEFKRLDHVLEYARRVHKVPATYLEKVLNIVGFVKADHALAVCRTRKVKSEAEMNKVLEDLLEVESEHVLSAIEN